MTRDGPSRAPELELSPPLSRRARCLSPTSATNDHLRAPGTWDSRLFAALRSRGRRLRETRFRRRHPRLSTGQHGARALDGAHALRRDHGSARAGCSPNATETRPDSDALCCGAERASLEPSPDSRDLTAKNRFRRSPVKARFGGSIQSAFRRRKRRALRRWRSAHNPDRTSREACRPGHDEVGRGPSAYPTESSEPCSENWLREDSLVLRRRLQSTVRSRARLRIERTPAALSRDPGGRSGNGALSRDCPFEAPQACACDLCVTRT